MTINNKLADVTFEKLSNAASGYNNKNVTWDTEFDDRYEIKDGSCEIKTKNIYG